MITKNITVSIDPDSVEILDNEILKTASEQDMLNGHKFDPDFVYLIVRACSAGEYWGPNNNTDYFEEAELLGGTQYGHETGYKTFMEAHVFKNHKNKDVAGSIGDVLKAEWDDHMKAVMLLIRIDKMLAPTITRGFLKGTITDVSMGCRVDHVVCSICGNRAKVSRDYCEHLRDRGLRGKILEGGKRVFEINKGPKFHDISVVTRGADRTAKSFKVIDGQKAAYDQSLQKVASLEDKIRGIQLNPEFALPETYKFRNRDFEKIAREVSMMKKAEVEKIITGNIVSIAGNEVVEEAKEKVGDVMDIMRLFHTDHFDKKTTNEIAAKINAVAAERKRPAMSVFKTFLRTAELSGIELTPLEFAAINAKLERKDASSIFDLSKAVADGMGKDSMNTVISISRGDGMDRNPGFSLPGSELDLEQDIFSRILKPFVAGRSSHPRYMRPRLVKIIKLASEETNSLDHFVLPLASMSKQASVELKKYASNYASYQDGRVDLAMAGDIERYASLVDGSYSEIVKEAMAPAGKSGRLMRDVALAATAFPLVHGYSKYQQSRMKEGRRVGGLNRYIAENPNSAFMVGAVGRHLGKKGLKKTTDAYKALPEAGKVKTTVSKIRKGEPLMDAVDPFAEGEDGFEAAMRWLDKEASDVPVRFNKYDLFSSEEVHKIASESYDEEKIAAMNSAIFEYFKGNESNRDEILKTAGLAVDDVNSYLKMAANLITIELEKMAGEIADVAKDTMVDTLFYPAVGGAGMGAMLPGSIVDGFLINKAVKHFENKGKKSQEAIKPPEMKVQNPKEVQ